MMELYDLFEEYRLEDMDEAHEEFELAHKEIKGNDL